MLVKNKRTNKKEEITPEVWQEMQAKGLASRFKVLSGESTPEKKLIDIPQEVKELRSKKKKNITAG